MWWQPRKPDEIEPLPWLAPEAIQYLEKIIRPDFEVIEHGSGGSTLWFAERVKSVTAFESDPDWQAIVKKIASNNTQIYSTRDQRVLAWDGFDLCLIDGEPIEDRAKWVNVALDIVKPGGWIVLDNANRPEYAAEREMLKEHAELVYSTPLVMKHLITEFYQVPELKLDITFEHDGMASTERRPFTKEDAERWADVLNGKGDE